MLRSEYMTHFVGCAKDIPGEVGELIVSPIDVDIGVGGTSSTKGGQEGMTAERSEACMILVSGETKGNVTIEGPADVSEDVQIVQGCEVPESIFNGVYYDL
jgi:hypothetical protein